MKTRYTLTVLDHHAGRTAEFPIMAETDAEAVERLKARVEKALALGHTLGDIEQTYHHAGTGNTINRRRRFKLVPGGIIDMMLTVDHPEGDIDFQMVAVAELTAKPETVSWLVYDRSVICPTCEGDGVSCGWCSGTGRDLMAATSGKLTAHASGHPVH